MSDAALVRAPFPRYWLSASLADFADGIRLAAFPLLAAKATSSPAAVAAVMAVQGLPWLVIGLGVGVLVDRHDLRRTMIVVDMARVAVIVMLAAAVAARVASIPLIYLTALVTGAGSMTRDTAASTALPRLVPAEELDRANGRLVAGRVVGNELAGPAAGGWLFGVAAVLPFAADASGLGLAILLLLTLPDVFAPLPQAQRPGTRQRPGTAGPPRSVAVDVRAGLAWLCRDRPVRDLVIAVGIVTAADGAYFAILVLYVTRALHQHSVVYGLLLGIGALGGITAGALCARLAAWAGERRLLTGSVCVLAATELVLGLTGSLVVAAAAIAASSGAFAVFNATSVSMRQRRAPAAMLGRVNSTYLTVARSAEAAGALAGGGLATVAGIRAPMLAGVIPLLAAAALIARLPGPRNADDRGAASVDKSS